MKDTKEVSAIHRSSPRLFQLQSFISQSQHLQSVTIKKKKMTIHLLKNASSSWFDQIPTPYEVIQDATECCVQNAGSPNVPAALDSLGSRRSCLNSEVELKWKMVKRGNDPVHKRRFVVDICGNRLLREVQGSLSGFQGVWACEEWMGVNGSSLQFTKMSSFTDDWKMGLFRS